MRNSALGPKLILSRTQVDDTEDIPEEPEDFDTIIIEKKKIKYKEMREDRFDAKGRKIKQGTGYGIQFDNFITVCVFDPSEEVVQIKDTLSNCTNGIDQSKINPRLDIKYKAENNGDEIILFSILKKQKNK
ncbi:unnamed protein product [Paramecium primaurelia]|uniref:Uncharacterized protein n=2 Tax=Paramecium TaxID=5884 RepID=A0A8S1VM83_9CILI|nr:unnamed protein product [Paramecium primaurelia]CAD8176692.1 unnamed protein product [Paramecium pentaurelia]